MCLGLTSSVPLVFLVIAIIDFCLLIAVLDARLV